jgi:VanZ family protein
LKNFCRHNLWGILWGLFILILVCIPGKFLPDVPQFIDLFKPDKLIHLFMFGLFVFLWIRGLSRQTAWTYAKLYPVFTALLLAIVFSGITELLQRFVIPGRISSIYDFTANVIGCLAGWVSSVVAVKKAGQKN